MTDTWFLKVLRNRRNGLGGTPLYLTVPYVQVEVQGAAFVVEF